MPKDPTPREVQITLADGRVMDFQTSLGDKITLTTTDTRIPSVYQPERPIRYYTLIIVPKEDDV